MTSKIKLLRIPIFNFKNLNSQFVFKDSLFRIIPLKVIGLR